MEHLYHLFTLSTTGKKSNVILLAILCGGPPSTLSSVGRPHPLYSPVSQYKLTLLLHGSCSKPLYVVLEITGLEKESQMHRSKHQHRTSPVLICNLKPISSSKLNVHLQGSCSLPFQRPLLLNLLSAYPVFKCHLWQMNFKITVLDFYLFIVCFVSYLHQSLLF